MKAEFSRQIFEKTPHIKFNENPSSGRRIVSCGWTDGQTDMTKVILALRNFTNGTKKFLLSGTKPQTCGKMRPTHKVFSIFTCKKKGPNIHFVQNVLPLYRPVEVM